MALDYSQFAASQEEAKLFHVAPFDNRAARDKMIARIARTAKQLNGEKVSPQGGKDFTTGHRNLVAYHPTLNGQAIVLPGVDGEARFSRDKLQALLTQFSKDVDNGAFDEQLEAALSSAGPKAAPATRTRSATKPASADKPWHLRQGFQDLDAGTKRGLGKYYSNGKNPDGSLISEVGHKPDAPYVPSKKQ